MWAHYAERHQGVALGFKVTDAFCTPIKYVPNVYPLRTANPQQSYDISIPAIRGHLGQDSQVSRRPNARLENAA